MFNRNKRKEIAELSSDQLDTIEELGCTLTTLDPTKVYLLEVETPEGMVQADVDRYCNSVGLLLNEKGINVLVMPKTVTSGWKFGVLTAEREKPEPAITESPYVDADISW